MLPKSPLGFSIMPYYLSELYIRLNEVKQQTTILELAINNLIVKPLKFTAINGQKQ